MRPCHGRSACMPRASGTIVVLNGRRAVSFRIGPLVWRLLAAGCFLLGATSLVPARGAEAQPGAPGSTIFTASDFAVLSRGVDFHTSGEAAVFAWAPGGQQWRL